MIEGLVSVVVPIYNVEKYLNRCIESIVSQTYANLEIILVDDESPDNCPQMCDEWASKDSRIKVVHKKNAGLGMARNTGIDNANGEYICFIDSDDYIAQNAVKTAYEIGKNNKADVVVYGFSDVDPEGNITKVIKPSAPKSVYSGDEIEEYIVPNMLAPRINSRNKSHLWMSMCCGLYSAACIEKTNWRMVSERQIISEDTYSLLKLYKSVERIAICSECFYYYCKHSSSLTHVYRKDRFEREKVFYDECVKLVDELGYSKAIKNYVAYPYLSNIIAGLKMIKLSNISKKEKLTEFSKIIKDDHLHKVLNCYDMRDESFNRKFLYKMIMHNNIKICYLLVGLKA